MKKNDINPIDCISFNANIVMQGKYKFGVLFDFLKEKICIGTIFSKYSA